MLTSIGPLIEPVGAAFRLSSTTVSLLVVIPVLCMGVFAPLTPMLIRRIGRDRLIACGLAVIGASTLIRAFAPNDLALIVSRCWWAPQSARSARASGRS